MTIELMREFFGWCAVINIGILLFWFGFLAFAHDWVYRFHSRWFSISAQKFDTVHYASIGIFKMIVFVFNIVPYFVLLILT